MGVAELVRHEGEDMSEDERLRYARHLVLPQIGPTGQQKLRQARVLLVGTGGLGSPVGLYLAGAGVGTLGLVDFDVVDISNLQRQVLHGTATVGRPKLESAAARIADINPHVRVVPYEARLTGDNALDILQDFDIVVDATDNFPTRYVLSEACVRLRKPEVYGAIFRLEGQLSVFDAREGPCYRCVFPEAPPPELAPGGAQAGVLGVIPGIIGAMQALETIKLILGIGPSLVGRMLLLDAAAARWRELKLRRDPQCPVCGHASLQQTVHAAGSRVTAAAPAPPAAAAAAAARRSRGASVAAD
jgi:adenylyltransferase/sulfurtransferase